MNKIIFLLLSISFIGCCSKSKLLSNGLTKSAIQISEFAILISPDSINNENRDTLWIKKERYNNNDQIINQQTLLDNEKMEIVYSYNKLNKVKKEIVKMSTDSLPLIVNYIYKNTLLYQRIGVVNYANEKFEQIETFFYRKNNTIEKSKTTLLFVNLNSSDTIANSTSTTYFNKKELATKIKTVHQSDPKRNRRIVNEYDCQNIIKVQEFNGKDSLISTTKYEYELDKFDNWTSKKIYKNGRLEEVLKREIVYR